MSAALLYTKKLLYAHKHLFIALFACLGCLGLLWHAWQSLFITQHYKLSVDACCSETVHTAINAYAQEKFKNIIFDEPTIAQLKSEFIYLKTIQARYIRPGSVEISCKAHKPIVRINDDQVMLENGCVVKKTLFKEEFLQELPAILVAHEENIQSPYFSHHVQQWLTDASDELFSQYNVQWINHMNIHLHDKKSPHFSLVTDSSKIPSDRCVAHYHTIKNCLLAQSKQKKSKDQKRWRVDIRFKNQFIVQTMHEGVA